LNEPPDRFERRYHAQQVFAPCGHYKENSPLQSRTEVEITLLTFDDLHSKANWIVDDDLFRLTSQVPDIRFVPIEFNLGARISPLQVCLVCRYTLAIADPEQ